MQQAKIGICYLVGAGAGDPGLLTLRARDCLARAEVVYHDHLASAGVLDFAPSAAELVYVGKQAGQHALPQEEINRLLVRDTAAGKTVVRLKGGDPYIFGRGGEEALALRAAELPFEVVPGISAAIAAGARAGIPLTHRGLSTAVTFVTGHESPDKEQTQTDWAALAVCGHTLCIYMGMGNLRAITGALLAGGRGADEPAAVIREASLPGQTVVRAALGDIAQAAEAAGVGSPAIVIVGAVAALYDTLCSSDSRPLAGKRVLVTRSREQAGALSVQLEARGARVAEFPCIAIFPVARECPDELRNMLQAGRPLVARTLLHEDGVRCDGLSSGLISLAAGEPDYVVFTSVNGVEHSFTRLAELGLDARVFAGARIAVIGSATADALRARGLRADIVPARFTSEALLAELESRNIAGARFLLLRADNASAVLPDGLRAAGAEVCDTVAYHALAQALPQPVVDEIVSGAYSALTFASAATVRAFCDALGAEGIRRMLNAHTPPVIASVGPVTSLTLRECGLPVDVEPDEATIPALARALAEFFLCGGSAAENGGANER